MSTSTISSTICKIAGIHLFVTAAQSVSWISLKTFFITGDFADFAISGLMTVAPPVIGGVLLWRYSDQIARVASESGRPTISDGRSENALLEVGVVLVGVYAVLFGLVSIINTEVADLWFRLSIENDRKFYDETLLRNWSRRVGNLLQLVLGGGLIYFRHSLVALLDRAQRRTGSDS